MAKVSALYLSTTSIPLTGLRLRLSFMPCNKPSEMPCRGFRLLLRVNYHNDISWPLLLTRLAPDLRPTYSTGQISGVKALFAISKLLCSCCVEYNVKKPSDKDAEAVVTPQSQIESFAIVCYNHPVGERWRLECIGINNEDLRDALFLLFEDYPGVDCSSEELSFTQPFVPFLHLWSRFVELVESVTEPVLRENLEILQHILKKQLKEAFKADEILQETGCVNFDHVPIAFTPGEVVLTKRDGVMSAALLKEIERVTSDDEKDVCYGFKVNQLDWDGLNCGVRESTFKIAEFEGDVPLGDLDIVPLKSHPRPEVIKERLIGRGRKFERLRREQHMIYNAHGREMIVHNTMMKASQSIPRPSKALTRTQGERAGDYRCQGFLRGCKKPQSHAQAFE